MKNVKCFPFKDYLIFAQKIQRGYDAIDSLEAIKNELAQTAATLKAVEKELAETNNLLSLEKERALICEQQKGNALSIIASKDNIINLQADNIKRLGGTPKYWNFSISAGYGYYAGPQVLRGFVVAATVGRTIFKF